MSTTLQRDGTAGTDPVADPVLAVDGLVRRFGEQVAVDGVSFHIGPGETYGLLGPNGAGKSTTIRMVCGLLRPEAGTVDIGGRRVDADAVEAKALIGFVPQDVALYPDLTARENLRFFGRLHRLRAAELATRVDDALADVDLVERADDRVDTFSGGMKRRLNIAAGLLHRPRLLVLDEPTVGLDPIQIREIRALVAELAAPRDGAPGHTVLLSTHILPEVQAICSRVILIHRGRKVIDQPLAQLTAKGTTLEQVFARVTASDADELPGAAAAGASS